MLNKKVFDRMFQVCEMFEKKGLENYKIEVTKIDVKDNNLYNIDITADSKIFTMEYDENSNILKKLYSNI